MRGEADFSKPRIAQPSFADSILISGETILRSLSILRIFCEISKSQDVVPIGFLGGLGKRYDQRLSFARVQAITENSC